MKTSAVRYLYDIVTHNCYGQQVWIVRVELNARQRRRASRLARAFGLSVEAFLEGFFDQTLPGQLPRDEAERPEVTEDHFRLEALCPELARRLERAARVEGKTPAALVAAAITSWINVAEEELLLHPRSGEVLAGHEELERWKVGERWVGPAEIKLKPEDQVRTYKAGRLQ